MQGLNLAIYRVLVGLQRHLGSFALYTQDILTLDDNIGCNLETRVGAILQIADKAVWAIFTTLNNHLAAINTCIAITPLSIDILHIPASRPIWRSKAIGESRHCTIRHYIILIEGCVDVSHKHRVSTSGNAIVYISITRHEKVETNDTTCAYRFSPLKLYILIGQENKKIAITIIAQVEAVTPVGDMRLRKVI